MAKTAKIGKSERNRIQYERMGETRASLEQIHAYARQVLDNKDADPRVRAVAEADFRYADGAIAMLDKWRLVLKKGMVDDDVVATF